MTWQARRVCKPRIWRFYLAIIALSAVGALLDWLRDYAGFNPELSS